MLKKILVFSQRLHIEQGVREGRYISLGKEMEYILIVRWRLVEQENQAERVKIRDEGDEEGI